MGKLFASDTPLTIRDLAKKLNYSVQCVYDKIHRKELPYHKIGHAVRFDPEELQEWWEGNLVEAQPKRPQTKGVDTKTNAA